MIRIATLSLVLICLIQMPLARAINVEQLTARPLVSEVKISPTGDYLAFRIFGKGKYSLRFMDRKTGKIVGGFSLNGQSEVGDFYWVNKTRVVGETLMTPVWQETPENYGELFGVNFDGSVPKLLFGYRSGDAEGMIKLARNDWAWARVAGLLPRDPNHILIDKTEFSERGNKHAELVRLNANDGHQHSLHLYTDYGDGRFYIDKNGHARVMTSVDGDDQLHVQTLPKVGGTWIKLDKSEFGEDFEPLALTDKGRSLYLLKDAKSGRLGLFKMSLDGTHDEKLYVNDTVDVTSAVRSTNKKQVYALRIDNGYPSYLIFSHKSKEATIFDALLHAFAGNLVYITSKSSNGRYWVVYATTDTDPGSFYLLDNKKHKLSLLVRSRPDLKSVDFAPMKPIHFASFDKEIIYGYFTAAKGAKPGTAPMVVLVHGGPSARDYWGYNGEVQVLATNGFSVLQINYRGSSGYGEKFLHQSDREWGDAVQKDIIAGTRWAIAQKMAPANKVCIMGGSFGAYSAVQSAEMAPDLFACVVANAGVYDLPLLYHAGDIQRAYFGPSFLEKAIGHDKAQLIAYSPVYHVDRLKAPVLIAHGKRDPRAPFKHAEELRAAMEKAHKKFEWFIKGREGHGFYNANDQRQYLETVLAFLHRYT